MTDTYTERICQSLERIATALETINEYGVTISTLYYEPLEVKGIMTVKED